MPETTDGPNSALPLRAQEVENQPRVLQTDRVLYVYVHPDAQMSVPKAEWLDELIHSPEPERGLEVSDRQLAAAVMSSYRYLLLECSDSEALARIAKIRSALCAYDNAGEQS